MTEISSDDQIKAIFQGYRRGNVQVKIPSAGTLSGILNSHVVKANQTKQTSFEADQVLVRLFASAAVEMWHRALHSFVVSAGITATSPIWSAVSGYYSSHYVMRGYAHLLGRYMLYKQKKAVTLTLTGGRYYCLLDPKTALDREHKTYWKIVRQSALFGNDPFNDVDVDTPQSDGAHRNVANYIDHIGGFDVFKALTLADVLARIRRISDIECSAPPIPNSNKFPDLENVQIIAYHRIVRFRSYLDQLLGDDNKFWNAHRSPQWCDRIVDFQVTQPLTLSAPTRQ